MIRQYLIITVGVISVSFAAIFIRLADAPPLIIASYRLLIASLVLWPLTLKYSGNELRHLTFRDVGLALISGVFLALHFGMWITSLSYTSVATSVILVTSSPLFVAIASYVFFKEKISWKIIVGIITCFIGTAFICYGNWNIGTDSFLGGILALMGALAVSGHLLIGRKLRQTMSILVYGSVTCSSAGLLLLFASLIWGYPLSGYTGNTYLMMILLALVPQLLGHLSLNWALRFVSATLVTIAVLGEPVGANILAFLILGETPKLFEILGSIFILAGIYTAFRKS
ncbi:MAG TPA: DMT family transporter [Dehalococcoidia bacterium]|nr:DMT family transporter [Dehalococcoidia bacterium]